MTTRTKFKFWIIFYTIMTSLNLKWANQAYQKEWGIGWIIFYCVFALIFIAEAFMSSYILIYKIPRPKNDPT